MFLSINLADASKSNGVFDIALALMGSDFAIDQFLAFSAASIRLSGGGAALRVVPGSTPESYHSASVVIGHRSWFRLKLVVPKTLFFKDNDRNDRVLCPPIAETTTLATALLL